ncbi:MAG: SCP2 sterol-binding domain-containing protein, partial [Bacilli bacterium]|nr:SCP2 sterol-binding domain-containing protein [Bacilli bacterium]
EPYEYYDNDCRIRTGAETLIDLVTGKLDAVKALEDGKISVDGDIEKALVLSDVLKATVVNKKSSEAKKPATASKSATSKKTTNKKASSK